MAVVSPTRKRLQHKANVLVLLGFVLSVAGRVLGRSGSVEGAGIGFVLTVVALFCWIPGLMAYAQSKGHSRWLGLLGFFTCIGLIVLALLPNKWVEPDPSGYVPGDYPRPQR